jgi:isoleucyl-tRNA synthetase
MLTNWYVRRSRQRFFDESVDAFDALYTALETVSRVAASLLPLVSEEIWRSLTGGRSVHLADWPEADTAAIDEPLSRVMRSVRELVSLGLQVRTTSKLRVRQPLEAAEIVLADPSLESALREHAALVADELNVHELRFVAKADDYVSYQVKPNFRALGPRAGKRMPKLKAALAGADGAALLRQLESEGCVRVPVDGESFELSRDEIAVSLEAREGFAAAAGGVGVVVLRTTLTPELLEEGRYREVLNRVQTLRKELDLEYTGRIRLTLSGAAALLDAVRPRVDELARETLAVDVAIGAEPPTSAEVREVAIDGLSLTLGLARL